MHMQVKKIPPLINFISGLRQNICKVLQSGCPYENAWRRSAFWLQFLRSNFQTKSPFAKAWNNSWGWCQSKSRINFSTKVLNYIVIYIEILLRSFWDPFEILLRSIWDPFEIPLRSFWDPFEILLRSSWDPLEILLRSFWYPFRDPLAILLRSFWDPFEILLRSL